MQPRPPRHAIGSALDGPVSEGLEIGAAVLEAARYGVVAERAEGVRLDRPRGRLHCRQQSVDQIVIELHPAVHEAIERRALKSDLLENLLPLGSAGEAVELR
jgi:hypothetical protein